ncbi:MAG TPA: glycosyltransferase family 2 protein [Candidatus Saccharimonadales bacterium]|nr:glycosyltransferase family 2 protein [Candidatus Saccharimonadales bacterium]
MNNSEDRLLSVVVPIYNERVGLPDFHAALWRSLHDDVGEPFEIIYVDDGSTDDTAELVRKWHAEDTNVRLLSLSRNFGKENALSAGIAAARGKAIISLDGDGQHPPELIPKFVEAWRNGAQVVIGVRSGKSAANLSKRVGSSLFYKLFNKMTGQKLLPGSTDYRLLDQAVRRPFLELTETDRITRGLIDWLGFKRQYINFNPHDRQQGTPGYGYRKLLGLATNSFVSLTLAPLYVFGYLGVIITFLAFLLGSAVLIEQILLDDPWHWKFTGTAMLGILIIFLVGIVLMSQGILSLYISHLHNQSKRRPLYVIDYHASAGIREHGED